MKLTANRLLALMQPEREYSAPHLSRLSGVPSADIRSLLDQLLTDRRIQAVKQAWQTFFRTADGEPPSTASKRQPAPEDNLSGYDSTLATQQRLALLARDRCR